MAEMVKTLLNGKWWLTIPKHRADRPAWHSAKGWERVRLDAMHDVIEPGDIVIDVGAEEGDMSALCAKWAGPTGGIFLVEPNPRVWPNIRAIWDSNNDLAHVVDWFVGFAAAETRLDPPNDNVTAVAERVLVANGIDWPKCAFDEVIGDHGFRHLAQEADATPQTRLDDFINKGVTHGSVSIDVITMDVEGSEFEVLKGAYDILANDRPVVFVSIHPAFLWDLYRTQTTEIHDWMTRLGYESQLLTIDHEEHWVFTHPEGRQR